MVSLTISSSQYHLTQWIVILFLSLYQLSIFKVSTPHTTSSRHADALQVSTNPDSFCPLATRTKNLREATTSLVHDLAYTIRFWIPNDLKGERAREAPKDTLFMRVIHIDSIYVDESRNKLRVKFLICRHQVAWITFVPNAAEQRLLL